MILYFSTTESNHINENITCDVLDNANSSVEIEPSSEDIKEIQNTDSFLTSTIVGISQIAGPSKPTDVKAAPSSHDSLDESFYNLIDCNLCNNSLIHKCSICDKPVCSLHSQPDPNHDNEMRRIHHKNDSRCKN